MRARARQSRPRCQHTLSRPLSSILLQASGLLRAALSLTPTVAYAPLLQPAGFSQLASCCICVACPVGRLRLPILEGACRVLRMQVSKARPYQINQFNPAANNRGSPSEGCTPGSRTPASPGWQSCGKPGSTCGRGIIQQPEKRGGTQLVSLSHSRIFKVVRGASSAPGAR